MITVLNKGNYRLTETKSQEKLLTLDDKTYTWVMNNGRGHISPTSRKPHSTGHVLATGIFRLYSVVSEAQLVNGIHLELNVGSWMWLGYLLPSGLPKSNRDRNPVLTTNIVISCKSTQRNA